MKIRKPWKSLDYSKWFNGPKKIYYLNNVVAVPHKDLLLYVNLVYPSSYHDVSIVKHSCLYKNQCTHF